MNHSPHLIKHIRSNSSAYLLRFLHKTGLLFSPVIMRLSPNNLASILFYFLFMPNNRSLFKILLYRDCLISYRQGSDYLLALSFWLLLVCFFPLYSNASPQLLQSFAPGIIWLGLLLTQLLNLPKLFRNDYHDGLIAELIQSPNDFFLII